MAWGRRKAPVKSGQVESVGRLSRLVGGDRQTDLLPTQQTMNGAWEGPYAGRGEVLGERCSLQSPQGGGIAWPSPAPGHGGHVKVNTAATQTGPWDYTPS